MAANYVISEFFKKKNSCFYCLIHYGATIPKFLPVSTKSYVRRSKIKFPTICTGTLKKVLLLRPKYIPLFYNFCFSQYIYLIKITTVRVKYCQGPSKILLFVWNLNFCVDIQNYIECDTHTLIWRTFSGLAHELKCFCSV